MSAPKRTSAKTSEKQAPSRSQQQQVPDRRAMDEFAKERIDDAKTLVTVEFPSKILDLRDRVDSVWLSLSNLSHIRDMAVESTRLPTAGNAEDEGQDPAEKRQKMDRQMHVPCNETLVEILCEARDILTELREHTDRLRQWTTLALPGIEDCGPDVEYKKTVSDVAEDFGDLADSWATSLRSYHTSRIKNINKMLKCTDEDREYADAMRQLIVESDMQAFVNARQIMVGAQKTYIQLYDLVINSWERLEQQSGANRPSAIMHG